MTDRESILDRLEQLEVTERGSTAEKLKRDGNTAFAAKKYEKAMESYTQALQVEAPVDKAVLYCNRSACLYRLKWYRESLEDAASAVKCNDKYAKVGFCAVNGRRRHIFRPFIEKPWPISNWNSMTLQPFPLKKHPSYVPKMNHSLNRRKKCAVRRHQSHSRRPSWNAHQMKQTHFLKLLLSQRYKYETPYPKYILTLTMIAQNVSLQSTSFGRI